MYASLVHLNDRMMKYVDIIVVASCAFLCFTIALQIFNRFFFTDSASVDRRMGQIHLRVAIDVRKRQSTSRTQSHLCRCH